MFGVLIGVAVWGHATDWTLPKFSALMGGSGQNGETIAWCKDHNVPEAICIECNSKLVPAERITAGAQSMALRSARCIIPTSRS